MDKSINYENVSVHSTCQICGAKSKVIIKQDLDFLYRLCSDCKSEYVDYELSKINKKIYEGKL